MSDKTLRQFTEDIEQRKQTLKQRSADAVQKYKKKAFASSQAITQRRADLSDRAKQSVADMLARKKEQEQQRASAKAAQQEKQDMKDQIKAELEGEREERQDDKEEKRKGRERKRMEKERKREQVQKTLDSVG